MLLRAACVVFFGLLPVFGQTPAERVFRSSQTNSDPEFQELATLMRAIGEICDVKADPSAKFITVRGTPAQIALVDWLFAKLDQPAVQGSGAHEYMMTGAEPLHAVGLLFIKNAADTREFQEIATLVRSITDFRYFFAYNASKALVFRGTPESDGRGTLAGRGTRPASGAGSAYGSARICHEGRTGEHHPHFPHA